MITVAILVNGNPIYTRSAVNKDRGDYKSHVPNKYRLDDGSIIIHKPDDGAIALAKKMLSRIKEV